MENLTDNQNYNIQRYALSEIADVTATNLENLKEEINNLNDIDYDALKIIKEKMINSLTSSLNYINRISIEKTEELKIK